MEFKETDNDTEDLCVVHFAKMFETTQKKPLEGEDAPVDIEF
jgi:hypothetical protein